MKIVHEMRTRRAFEQQKSSGPLPIILGAVIAFGIGLLGVSGIVKMSFFNPGPTTTAAVAVPAGANDTKAERDPGKLQPNRPRRDCAIAQDVHPAATPGNPPRDGN